ncbi:ComEC/Rec2 family competence protein, partial [Zavarzinia sp.]|uniref:ComEC/Rec2 family competence protein n=1 Tax=Zavarzinia sp. TaxID=2027920 RepID=UPI003BB4CD1F
PEGGIAAALMLGLRGAVPEAVEERWRAAGISHILSISGLHIGLAAGIVLFALRFLLASIAPLSLRLPVKKWAAAAAILSAGAYMVVAGMDVPAQRSFIMTAIVLVAVLVDRLAITLRLVAIAAAIILLIEPESLSAPGFGMSFASVTALVAVYEAARPRIAAWRAGGGWFRRGWLALGGILVSSVIATLATAPFAIAHFGRLSIYGLVANLLAIPLTGFVIMPAAVATAALAPFGLEAPALAVLGFGIRLVDDLALAIEPLPGAALAVPAMGQGALLLFVLGGLCLCLWRGGFRLSGLPLLAAGCVVWLAGVGASPRLLIHGEGRAVAAPVGGRLLALPPASPRFVVEQWAERLGLPEPEVLAAREACRKGICSLTLEGGDQVTVVSDRAAAVPECTAVVILLRETAIDCPAPTTIITRTRLSGSGVLVLTADGRLETAEAGRGRRPWTPGYRPDQ